MFILSLEQNLKKILHIKNDVLCNVLNENKVNKMHTTILSQQVEWIGRKEIDFHVRVSKINFHK
jgi:hypothetical protein